MVAPPYDLPRRERRDLGKRVPRCLEDGIEIAFAYISAAHSSNTRHLAQRIHHTLARLERRSLGEHDQNAAGDAYDALDRLAVEQALDVMDEPPLERRAIMALQPELVIVHEADALEAGHASSFVHTMKGPHQAGLQESIRCAGA